MLMLWNWQVSGISAIKVLFQALAGWSDDHIIFSSSGPEGCFLFKLCYQPDTLKSGVKYLVKRSDLRA